MTLVEIFSTEAREQQAAAKAAVLQWLGGYNVERFGLEKHRAAVVSDAEKGLFGNREARKKKA